MLKICYKTVEKINIVDDSSKFYIILNGKVAVYLNKKGVNTDPEVIQRMQTGFVDTANDKMNFLLDIR